MDFIEIKHIQRTIEFCRAKEAEYAKESKRYAGHGIEGMANRYEGRGDAFGQAANFLERDIELFGENVDDPIAHLIGEPA